MIYESSTSSSMESLNDMMTLPVEGDSGDDDAHE